MKLAVSEQNLFGVKSYYIRDIQKARHKVWNGKIFVKSIFADVVREKDILFFDSKEEAEAEIKRIMTLKKFKRLRRK